MVLRKSSVLTGLMALFFSCWVSALGLGELTLHSALDEPFDAEIELVNIGDADEGQILVGLASKEDFERAGVSWEFHLLNLTFKTDLSDASRPVVKVSSKESIREPYLDFVTELQWPAGRLLREYTLFLDLPVFDLEKVAASAQAPVTPMLTKKNSSNTESRQNVNTTVQQNTTTSNSGSKTALGSDASQYRVKGGDTLWEIASRTKRGASSIQQRMMAIHSVNSSAFIQGNINLLKKGAVLRMPDLASVEGISQSSARQQVADQSRLLNEQNKKDDVARELIGDVPVTQQNSNTKASEGLLRLSVPSETDSSSSSKEIGRATASAEGTGSSEVLQNELNIAQEELDRSKRENLELKAKLANLENQLNTASKLIELESDDLKAVQLGVSAKATKTGSDTDTAETAAVDVPGTVSDSTGVDDKGRGAEGITKGPLGGLFAFLQANWMPLVGLLVVLLGVVFLVAKSKKEDQPTPVEPFLSSDVDTTNAEPENTESEKTDTSVEEDSSFDSEPSVVETEDQELSEMAEQVDPIGEADIYSSLGNFNEAEDVIENAIKSSPDDSRLHLKLLDLYAAQNDAKRFDTYYPTLVALEDDDATATADRLRSNIVEEIDESAGSLRELTLEEQVAEELGIADLELDLTSSVETKDKIEDGTRIDLDEEQVSNDLELDLSEMELDLEPVVSTTNANEDSNDELEDSLFSDMSLPDDLPENLSTESSAGELNEIESSEVLINEINLTNSSSEVLNGGGLELSLDSLDFDDDDLDIDINEDESNTQLELAQAYMDMNDEQGAKDILADVLLNGSDEQKKQANDLLAKLA